MSQQRGHPLAPALRHTSAYRARCDQRPLGRFLALVFFSPPLAFWVDGGVYGCFVGDCAKSSPWRSRPATLYWPGFTLMFLLMSSLLVEIIDETEGCVQIHGTLVASIRWR
jgi:hypothetical protein